MEDELNYMINTIKNMALNHGLLVVILIKYKQ